MTRIRRLRLTRLVIAAAWSDFLNLLLGARCLVTGDRVFPGDREVHHDMNHPTEGPCA